MYYVYYLILGTAKIITITHYSTTVLFLFFAALLAFATHISGGSNTSRFQDGFTATAKNNNRKNY